MSYQRSASRKELKMSMVEVELTLGHGSDKMIRKHMPASPKWMQVIG